VGLTVTPLAAASMRLSLCSQLTQNSASVQRHEPSLQLRHPALDYRDGCASSQSIFASSSRTLFCCCSASAPRPWHRSNAANQDVTLSLRYEGDVQVGWFIERTAGW